MALLLHFPRYDVFSTVLAIYNTGNKTMIAISLVCGRTRILLVAMKTKQSSLDTRFYVDKMFWSHQDLWTCLWLPKSTKSEMKARNARHRRGRDEWPGGPLMR